MTPQDFQDELDNREVSQKADAKDARKQQSIEGAKAAIIDAMVQSTKANMKHRASTTTKVEVQNPGADTTDINRAIEAINNVAVLMLSQGQQKGAVNLVDGTDLGERLSTLGDTLSQLLAAVRDDSKQDKTAEALTAKLDSLISQLKTLQVAPDPDAKQSLANIESVLKGLNLSPKVTVPAPKVTVQGKDIDLSPLVGLLNEIKDVLNKPEVEDHSDITSGLAQVQTAIENLSFPVPNYVLPFKDVDGKATQVQLDAAGKLPISASISGADGAVLDGANATIKASVLDLTDSNPQAVAIVDSNGDQISSFGGGTQYTDAGTPPTHPVGTELVYNNGGTWAAVSTTNTLPVATGLTQPTTPSDTQPISAASLPLPTGAATGAKQDTGNTSLGNIDTSTAASKTDLDTIAGAVSSSKMATKMADGDSVTLGAKADAKSTATDTTAVTMMQVLKEISFMEQNPASRAVTNAGTFAVQATLSAETTKVIGTVNIAASQTVGLVAGSAVVGKVSIDQTTPGTTNLVALAANQSVNVAQMNGVATSMGVGASGTGTQRVVIANDAGKTLLSKAGSASSSGNNTLVAAGTNRLKVFAFSLSTTSATAVTCIFQDGASGTALWEVILQAPTSVSTGANLVVQPPAWLFATSSATLLNLNLSSAQTVLWSVSYFDEA